MTTTTQPATEELQRLSASFEAAPAEEIFAWAASFAGDRMVVSSSFSDAVLAHLVHRFAPRARVVFIDTGFHFPETLSYVQRVAGGLGLRLEVVSAALPTSESPCGTPDCCARRKVEPLHKALSGAAAWVTGIRRDETPERAASPIISWDERYGLVKVNPLATWSFDEVVDYIDKHDLPVHPLVADGYLSIGCAPVTVPVRNPDDPRSGRWPGMDKTECGLHL